MGDRLSPSSGPPIQECLSPAPPSEPLVPVRLEPFIHQVGGSSAMLAFDRDTLCKPLQAREYAFYKSLQGPLHLSMAEYRGSVEVECKAVSDHEHAYIGYFPEGLLERLRSSRRTTSSQERSPEEVDEESSPPCADRQEVISSQYENPKEKLAAEGLLGTRLRKLFNKEGKRKRRFILLENIVSRFHCPCVLDLKMGTRQHGDEENTSKSERKLERCVTTTSALMGLRVGGMQVFHKPTGKYFTKDKYWGRHLDAEGVRNCLQTFLYNGETVHVEIISHLIEKLKGFHTALSNYNSYRFYSSSLLLIYDGWCEPPLGAESPVELDKYCDIRMCDFAHTTFEGFGGDRLVHYGPDGGYLLGVNNLISLLSDVKESALSAESD